MICAMVLQYYPILMMFEYIVSINANIISEQMNLTYR